MLTPMCVFPPLFFPVLLLHLLLVFTAPRLYKQQVVLYKHRRGCTISRRGCAVSRVFKGGRAKSSALPSPSNAETVRVLLRQQGGHPPSKDSGGQRCGNGVNEDSQS